MSHSVQQFLEIFRNTSSLPVSNTTCGAQPLVPSISGSNPPTLTSVPSANPHTSTSVPRPIPPTSTVNLSSQPNSSQILQTKTNSAQLALIQALSEVWASKPYKSKKSKKKKKKRSCSSSYFSFSSSKSNSDSSSSDDDG